MTDYTQDHDDDLTPHQEYVIAGIVILLFGLLYWFLNHGWNSDSDITIPQTRLPVTESPLKPGKADISLTAATSPAPEPSVTPATTADMKTGTTGITASPATQQAQPDTASLQAEIDQLKAENTTLKQAEAERIKSAQTTNQQAAAPTPDPSSAQPDTAASVAGQTTETNIYTLPDGSQIELAATGLEPAFKLAIINKELNKPLVFDNIYFETGSTSLNPASDHQIKAIAALMNKHQDIKVMLRGHTDNVGLPGNNAQLSLIRANTVGLALVAQGIDRQRIRIMGMGDTNPVETNATDVGRQHNRRIDISIIE
ncbi:MAG: OmpA family protein [Gammaproteobacteria bacterium]|nr:OmpA family protein [Gammaproteobacteria bacterium]MBU1725270.1 OmpA family protein [Gammaproteobacteria bacterium]MBU2006774.1 OmpA family protein [Gammaproteobacteria bacterium]